jgi:hypothetical protein
MLHPSFPSFSCQKYGHDLDRFSLFRDIRIPRPNKKSRYPKFYFRIAARLSSFLTSRNIKIFLDPNKPLSLDLPNCSKLLFKCQAPVVRPGQGFPRNKYRFNCAPCPRLQGGACGALAGQATYLTRPYLHPSCRGKSREIGDDSQKAALIEQKIFEIELNPYDTDGLFK